MTIEALTSALGADASALQHSDQMSQILGEGSSGVVAKQPILPETHLATSAIEVPTTDSVSMADNMMPAMQLYAAQIRDLENRLSEQTLAVNDANHKPEGVQAFKFPDPQHGKSMMADPSVLAHPPEQLKAASSGSVLPGKRKHSNDPPTTETSEIDARHDAGNEKEFERSVPHQTLSKSTHSSLEETVASLSLQGFYELQVRQYSPLNAIENAIIESDDEPDTICEPDGELDSPGSSSDDTSQTSTPFPVDQVILHNTVDHLVSAYLANVASRQGVHRQQAETLENVPGSQGLRTDAAPAPGADSNLTVSNKTRERLEDVHETHDRAVSRKRKKTDQRKEEKVFACPYSKFDKRRYSAHNINEVCYRHCSSTFSVNIHRLKGHLYRVHQRPDYYCPRCFTIFDSRELLDEHSRAIVPCSIDDCPFGERMTYSQLEAIKKRTTTKDQVEIWYMIYEILFPGSSRPESPYWEEASPEGVEDFEQWFVGQHLVLHDIFATRVAQNLPRLPQEVRNILDTVLEECLSELARVRGRDFHLPPSEGGPSTWMAADFEIHGTTALEVAEEFDLLDAHTTAWKPRTSEAHIAEGGSDFQPELIADQDLHEVCELSNADQVTQNLPHQTQNSPWEELTAEDWAVADSSMPLVDTFGECWEALSHDPDFTTLLQHTQNDDEPPEVLEGAGCSNTQNGKGKAQEPCERSMDFDC
jgi:hypothetical protein